MRRVALIYNPASGQYSARRAAAIEAVLGVLRKAGVETEALETDAPGSARTLARMAARGGFDTVLACGGDGTVHEVLQSLAGTEVALGVVPLGTANALAQDLGLGRSPVRAVRKLLDAEPMDVPVGRIWYRDAQNVERARFFTVAAGVGADALLMKSMDAGLKRKLGYVLYLYEAVRIWATHPFPLFQAKFTLNGSGAQAGEISQLLAIRIRSFGAALGSLAPGASVHNRSLSLISFATRSRLRYLRFLLAVLAGRQTFSNSVELLNASAVECLPRNGSKKPIYVEADGEVLGQLPARMEIAAETLRLLVPRDAQP
ncbi:MAG TPA: diacylglycerol kinase family protein [Terracidiphilus sp.]|nr:diacylglycerol kinase family protein [Terracidiphilus sp.]